MYKFPFYTSNPDELQWEAITEYYLWIKDMLTVEQDHIWHSEGNVNIHTMMVTKELLRMEEFHQETEQARHILFQSALMHDIEKRSTTVKEWNEEEQRECISAPKHAKKGEYTTRSLLYQNAVPFEIREQICKMVRWHGVPIWTIEKNDPTKTVLETSLHLPNKWLSLLARADVKGRICKDEKDLLFRINLFDEICKENEVWDTPYKFKSDLGKFLYFADKNKIYPEYEPYDDYDGEIIIMCGLPGAGKSTYIENNLSHLPIISMDTLRKERNTKRGDKKSEGQIVQEVKEMAKAFLRKKESFVWDAMNITKLDRDKLVMLATTYKAKPTFIYIEPEYNTLFQQNKNRDYPVPEKTIKNYLNGLEIPSATEAINVKYITP